MFVTQLAPKKNCLRGLSEELLCTAKKLVTEHINGEQ